MGKESVYACSPHAGVRQLEKSPRQTAKGREGWDVGPEAGPARGRNLAGLNKHCRLWGVVTDEGLQFEFREF